MGRGTSQVALSGGREAQPVLVSRSSSPATFCHRRANDTAPVQRKSGAILATCGFYQGGSGSEARRATNTRATTLYRVHGDARRTRTRHAHDISLSVRASVRIRVPFPKPNNDTLVVAVVRLMRSRFSPRNSRVAPFRTREARENFILFCSFSLSLSFFPLDFYFFGSRSAN